jgi:hypothetical protein
LFALGIVGEASGAELAELYSAKAIVTGQSESNRQSGFRDCLERVLVKVSGDQRLARRPELGSLKREADRLVQSYSYRDRLEGIPIHDEQGTHDRPHDLTCNYDPVAIDGVLAGLGSHPWLGDRPSLAVFLGVERGGQTFLLADDDKNNAAMREAFANAAQPMVMRVTFPATVQLRAANLPEDLLQADQGTLEHLTDAAGAEGALSGTLIWSDADRGWVATWRLADKGGRAYRWQVHGVSFDEAFRVAIRGSAQILSGNGAPD